LTFRSSMWLRELNLKNWVITVLFTSHPLAWLHICVPDLWYLGAFLTTYTLTSFVISNTQKTT
jgi:hypothetical protein